MRNENTGLQSIVTWQEALDLFTRLCAGRADISYGDRLIGSYRLPVLEARLDDPARLLPPLKQGNLHSWTECTVSIGDDQDNLPAEAYHLPETGAAAAAYAAFLSLAELLELIAKQLPRDTFQWAWYNIPVPTFCDDGSLMEKRVRAAYEKGAVLSLWLRLDEDEPVQKALRSLPAYGQVRIHNLTTAHTWIAGAEDESGLARAFGLIS